MQNMQNMQKAYSNHQWHKKFAYSSNHCRFCPKFSCHDTRICTLSSTTNCKLFPINSFTGSWKHWYITRREEKTCICYQNERRFMLDFCGSHFNGFCSVLQDRLQRMVFFYEISLIGKQDTLYEISGVQRKISWCVVCKFIKCTLKLMIGQVCKCAS